MSYNLEELKDLIMNEFRKLKCKEGECLPFRNLQFGLFNSLNPKEKDLVEDALNSLHNEGLLEYKENKPDALFLTKKGFDGLYSCRSDEELSQLIMSLFSKSNLGVGQGFMFRTLEMNVIQELNPVEQDQIMVVLNKLIADNIISIDSDNHFLCLCPKGFDMIY
ncbi:MAG: hypothetical protein KBT27_04790 [Prevotellaceae bacterium]|nr:hypothetical protein [Candidatus Colimorpha pelethequi]MBQ0088630.1 hypothetical protein [Candidatus Faecinaster equi]